MVEPQSESERSSPVLTASLSVAKRDFGQWQDLAQQVDLDQVPLFKDVDRIALQSALQCSPVWLLQAGATLLRPGEQNESVYIFLIGEMAAFLDAEGYRSEGIPITSGQCVGEFSAIDGKPVSALVQATSNSTILELTKDVLWAHLILLPGFARNLMTGLTERMRVTNRLTLEAQRQGLELAQLRKELQFAHELQAGMLPLHRPLFPDRSDLEVCALMEPASAVGGDFFDVFFVDPNRLFLCIGDVSGHGVGAALLMARAIGLVRILAISAQVPDQILKDLNDRLCEGNDISSFITIFCGLLDLRSGELQYSNAGHCAPIIVTEAGTTLLPIPPGLLIGVFPDANYTTAKYILKPDDILLSYTDGITEAEDASGDAFAEQRCMDFLRQRRLEPLDRLVDELRLQVRQFTGVDTLEDDGTLLALRRISQEAAPESL